MITLEECLNSATIRTQCLRVFQAATEGRTPHFEVRLQNLSKAIERTLAVTQRNYPDGKIPFIPGGGIFRPVGWIALQITFNPFKNRAV
jgi:hypothetical protein